MENNFIVESYKLDNQQMELLNSNKNALVIAGAGSGKTLTIIGKVNYLIEKCNYKEEEILVISFTNATVNDIKKRIKHNIDIYTFHKLAISILEKFHCKYKICNEKLLTYIIEETLLNSNLQTQKLILKYLKLNISYKSFLKSQFFTSFTQFILTFINLYKANGLSKRDIDNIKWSKLEKQILILIFNVYKTYLVEKKSNLLLDFDDIISYATEKANKVHLKYKYIIVDEFQDTSIIRLNLIKEIVKSTHSNLIVVGDDWQSIYRFSGCDLNIFLNFKNYFNDIKEIKLENTYRNSLELINVAKKFIMKNPLQINKSLKSSIHNNNSIEFVSYTNPILSFKKIINTILKYSNDIMIIVRNNKDIYAYIDNTFSISNNSILYMGNILKFYTVHKSKGLEAKYVIVLNCNNEYTGFPNKIENSKIISKLLPNHEIKYAEERRLFYVAITRCKEKVYLLYDKTKPSIFIKEIKKIIKKQK